MSKILKSLSDGLTVRIKFMGQYGRPPLATAGLLVNFDVRAVTVDVCLWNMNGYTLLRLLTIDKDNTHSTEGPTPAPAGGPEVGASRAEATTVCQRNTRQLNPPVFRNTINIAMKSRRPSLGLCRRKSFVSTEVVIYGCLDSRSRYCNCYGRPRFSNDEVPTRDVD